MTIIIREWNHKNKVIHIIVQDQFKAYYTCTSHFHNVARRSSSDMQVLFELLCPKVSTRFLMEDVNNKSFSHGGSSAQPQVISLSIFAINTQLNERRKKECCKGEVGGFRL